MDLTVVMMLACGILFESVLGIDLKQSCTDATEDENCGQCAKGYFGDPLNGESCSRCQCTNPSNTCHHRTGECYCTIKGVIGDNCEQCDQFENYSGDPIEDACFFDVVSDYNYNFELTKARDKNITAINFKNTPPKPEIDVDFTINCTTPSKVSAIYRRLDVSGAWMEFDVFSQIDCNETTFEHTFPWTKYRFGDEKKTTLHIFVYDFKTPQQIFISFAQQPKIDLFGFLGSIYGALSQAHLGTGIVELTKRIAGL